MAPKQASEKNEALRVQEALIVYKNLPDLLRYRGYTHTGEWMTDDQFVTAAQASNIVYVDGVPSSDNGPRKQADRKPITIGISIATDSKAPIRSADSMEKAINSIADKKNDVMLILPDDPNASATKRIVERREKLEVYIEVYTYRPFIVIVPEHDSVPQHTILDNKTASQIVADLALKSSTQLPLINTSDPPVIWMGGRPRDVIMIIRPSETSGYATAYRRVVQTPAK